MATEPRATACPCGALPPYADCCGPLHAGAAAATAEALMRSRFSAFARGDAEYLSRTWHSGTRPARIRLDPPQRWTRLEILGAAGGSVLESTGTVEFRAHYRQAGQRGSLHERSRFERERGEWRYVDGTLLDS